MDTGDLVDAVRAHRVVELEYRGRSGVGSRIVHPHATFSPAPDYNPASPRYRHGLLASA